MGRNGTVTIVPMTHVGPDQGPIPASQLGFHLGEMTVQHDVQTAFSEGSTIASLLLHNPRWSEIPSDTLATVVDWTGGSPFDVHGVIVHPQALTVTEQFRYDPPYKYKSLGGIAIVASSFDYTSEFAESLHSMRERLGKVGVICLIEKQPIDRNLKWREEIIRDQGFVAVGGSHHHEWVVAQGRLPKIAQHEPVNLFDRYGPSGMIWAIRREVAEQYQRYSMTVTDYQGIDARLVASRFIPNDLKMYRRGYGVSLELACGCAATRDLLGGFQIVPRACDSDHAELDIVKEKWVDERWEKANKRQGYGLVEKLETEPEPIEDGGVCMDCGGPREIFTYSIGEVRPDNMRYFRMLMCRGSCYNDIQREWYVDVPV